MTNAPLFITLYDSEKDQVVCHLNSDQIRGIEPEPKTPGVEDNDRLAMLVLKGNQCVKVDECFHDFSRRLFSVMNDGTHTFVATILPPPKPEPKPEPPVCKDWGTAHPEDQDQDNDRPWEDGVYDDGFDEDS